jgi:hypothetical protein
MYRSAKSQLYRTEMNLIAEKEKSLSPSPVSQWDEREGSGGRGHMFRVSNQML